MPKVNKLTSQEKQEIIDKSPLTLPDNPTQSGYSSAQIKQKMSGMVTDTEKSVLAVLDSKLEEIDDAFTDTDGDVTAIDGRLTTVEGKVSTLEGQNLNTRLTTAEGEIDTLQSDVNIAESDIDSLESRMNTAESDIDSLQTFVGNEQAVVDGLQAEIDNHEARVDNPHSVTKAQVGLGNVDNTSDANKPVSTATQTALNSKADLVAGKVPASQLPGFVDDVIIIESATIYNASNPIPNGVVGSGPRYNLYQATGNPVIQVWIKPIADSVYVFDRNADVDAIYVNRNTNITYRLSASVAGTLVEISSSLALGETSSTAYRGDRGATAYNHSQATGNPHGLTINDIGAEPANANIQTHVTTTNGTNPHNTTFANIASKPTTIAGYGITDAYTKTEADRASIYAKNIIPLMQPDQSTINAETYTPTIYLSSALPGAPTQLGAYTQFIVVRDDAELTDISYGLWTWNGSQWVLYPGGPEPYATNYLYSIDVEQVWNNKEFKIYFAFENLGPGVFSRGFRRIDNRKVSEEQFEFLDENLNRVIPLKSLDIYDVNNEGDFPNASSGEYILAQGDIGDGTMLWKKKNNLNSQLSDNWDLVAGNETFKFFTFRLGDNPSGPPSSPALYNVVEDPNTYEIKLVPVFPDKIYQDVVISTQETPTSVLGQDSKKLSLIGKSLITQSQPLAVSLVGLTTPSDMVFANNGFILYVTDSGLNKVNQYNLTTAYTITAADLLNPTFSLDVSVQATDPRGIDIRPDGTEIFVLSNGFRRVSKYTLSSPFNLSTATFTVFSQQIPQSGETFQSLRFKPDGTRFYVANSTDDTIEVWSTAAPWDMSQTITQTAFFSVGTQESSVTGIAFNNDGTKLYVIGSGQDDVFQYAMTTPWGNNAVYENKSLITVENTPTGIALSNDGTKLFVVGSSSDGISTFLLYSPFDVSSISGIFDIGFYLKSDNYASLSAVLEIGYSVKNPYLANVDTPIFKLENDGTATIANIKDSNNSTGTDGQVLSKVSGNMRWSNPQGLTTASITIGVADWVANTATIAVAGVTASNIVWVSPSPASYIDFGNAQVRATAQGSGTLTFTCTTTPTSNINVNLVIGS